MMMGSSYFFFIVYVIFNTYYISNKIPRRHNQTIRLFDSRLRLDTLQKSFQVLTLILQKVNLLRLLFLIQCTHISSYKSKIRTLTLRSNNSLITDTANQCKASPQQTAIATKANTIGSHVDNLITQANTEKTTQIAAITCPIGPTPLPPTGVCGVSALVKQELAGLATLTC